jgi:hypothetical protein
VRDNHSQLRAFELAANHFRQIELGLPIRRRSRVVEGKVKVAIEGDDLLMDLLGLLQGAGDRPASSPEQVRLQCRGGTSLPRSKLLNYLPVELPPRGLRRWNHLELVAPSRYVGRLRFPPQTLRFNHPVGNLARRESRLDDLTHNPQSC